MLRNLDELNLRWLSAGEREQVFRAFAPEESMRIYGRGIRRRVAPMLGGDRRRIELAYSLLFAMTGAPLITYGDEIGLGDDLSLPGREAVHVAMQWSDAPNAGFSSASEGSLARPPVRDGPFGYGLVNVAVQQRDPNSLLNWMKKLIAVRRQSPEIGDGDYELIETGAYEVLGQQWRDGNDRLVVLHNLSSKPCEVRADLAPEGARLQCLLGKAGEPVRDGKSARLTLPPYGYHWYRVGA